MRLLLFDIDGTLLTTNGAGRAAVESALSDFLGRSISTDAVSFSGKTDPQIMREVLRTNGIEATEQQVDEAVAVYATTARKALEPAHVTVLPGVRQLLDALASESSVQLALLTGNVEPMAYAKLGAAAMGAYFPFGAFGSDHADRSSLPAIAVDRARSHTGRAFAGHNVVIIGDTANDVRCGRGIGAKSVAVCTGRYGRADLAPHDPSLLVDDLTNTDAVKRALLTM